MVARKRKAGIPQHPIRSSEELYRLIERLCAEHAFPHPVQTCEILETHISYVVLTGEFAYKFKKPVNLGFLNFTDPVKREYYLQEEQRLNDSLSPGWYLGLVPVTGDAQHPALDGKGPLLEYALKMRQFPTRQRLDLVADEGKLRCKHIDTLAKTIAHFHQSTPAAQEDTRFGDMADIIHPVLENFSQLTPLIDDEEGQHRLQEIRAWTEKSMLMLQTDFQQRRIDGWIRECHGDLHLGNIALNQDKVLLFDRLEFSESLRWIDTMNDVAFLLMDLEQRGYRNFAMRFLNRYLEITGDYLGLGVLCFYAVYRAMVRAKVAMIKAKQLEKLGEDPHQEQQRCMHYLETAQRYTHPREITPLIITYGLSGSGKSWVSEQLSEKLGALRVRSDVERKRMFQLKGTDKVPSPVGQGMYKPNITRETYRRLHAAGYMILDAGCPVILDATFLDQENRDMMRKLAKSCRVPYIILDIQAPTDIMRERIGQRSMDNENTSDAGIEILEHQLANQQTLSAEEQPYRLTIYNDHSIDIDDVVNAVRTRALEQSQDTGS